MLQKDCKRNVYFSTDMIEVIELNWPPHLALTLSKQVVECYENLKCSECDGVAGEMTTETCRADMFDSARFLRSIKLTRALQIKQRLRKAIENNPASSSSRPSGTITTTMFPNTQSSLFYTQNDAEYFTVTQTHHQHHHNHQAAMNVIGDKSQYVKLNSILDALEHTGYYGFVTFIGCVQCASLNALSSSSSSTVTLAGQATQKTPANTQLLRTQSLSTQCHRNK